MANGKTWEGTF
jgi:hypothetical protein